MGYDHYVRRVLCASQPIPLVDQLFRGAATAGVYLAETALHLTLDALNADPKLNVMRSASYTDNNLELGGLEADYICKYIDIYNCSAIFLQGLGISEEEVEANMVPGAPTTSGRSATRRR